MCLCWIIIIIIKNSDPKLLNSTVEIVLRISNWLSLLTTGSLDSRLALNAWMQRVCRGSTVVTSALEYSRKIVRDVNMVTSSTLGSILSVQNNPWKTRESSSNDFYNMQKNTDRVWLKWERTTCMPRLQERVQCRSQQFSPGPTTLLSSAHRRGENSAQGLQDAWYQLSTLSSNRALHRLSQHPEQQIEHCGQHWHTACGQKKKNTLRSLIIYGLNLISVEQKKEPFHIKVLQNVW